jgi:hypothetical protein
MRILESAVLGPTGQILGATVWGAQFLGARFRLTQAARVTAVAGHLVADFSEQLFAAIVALSSSTRLPAFAPRSIEASALGAVLFSPPRPSGDVFVPMSVALSPGDYGLVFGGADSAVSYFPFGARGTGAMPLNNVPFPTSSYFLGDDSRWVDDDPSRSLAHARFVVEAELSDSSAPAAPTGVRVS